MTGFYIDLLTYGTHFVICYFGPYVLFAGESYKYYQQLNVCLYDVKLKIHQLDWTLVTECYYILVLTHLIDIAYTQTVSIIHDMCNGSETPEFRVTSDLKVKFGSAAWKTNNTVTTCIWHIYEERMFWLILVIYTKLVSHL